ncbi:MAG: hypothetical protein JWL76_923 [Thermoleophilia bacterium]|nr:hypothetical protein [Thermoleophilia bacterium]
MGDTIGSMLNDLGALRTRLMTPVTRTSGGAANSSAGSFAAQLDASFRARAEQLGLELPAAPTATGTPDGDAEDVEAIWKRAQLQSAALNGTGDALMQAVGDAADARWDKRHHRGAPDLFDM